SHRRTTRRPALRVEVKCVQRRSSILERHQLWPDHNLPVLPPEAPGLWHTVRPIPLSRRGSQVRSLSAKLPSPCSIAPRTLLCRPATLAEHTFPVFPLPSQVPVACLLCRLQRKQSDIRRNVCS